MWTPVNPSFTIQKWGARGYKSHGHVILMGPEIPKCHRMADQFFVVVFFFVAFLIFIMLRHTPTLIFFQILDSDTLWLPLPPSEVLLQIVNCEYMVN